MGSLLVENLATFLIINFCERFGACVGLKNCRKGTKNEKGYNYLQNVIKKYGLKPKIKVFHLIFCYNFD